MDYLDDIKYNLRIIQYGIAFIIGIILLIILYFGIKKCATKSQTKNAQYTIVSKECDPQTKV